MNIITRVTQIIFAAIVLLCASSYGQATKLAIVSISPSTPTAGQTFNITVQSQNAAGVPTNVSEDAYFYIESNVGDITQGAQSEIIASGTNQIVLQDVKLTTEETGVVITATVYMGQSLESGSSAPFNVAGPATQLAFVSFPSTGAVNTNVSSFTVQARRSDGSLDGTYTGSVSLSVVSGPGSLSGNGASFANGVATFSTLKFSAAGTYVLSANSAPLTQATSGNITITISPVSIFANTITGTNPAASSPYTTGQTKDAKITVSGIGRGPGIQISGTSVNDRYNAQGWNSTSFDPDDYFTFTLTPNTGYQIIFSNLTYTSQKSANGPANFAVRSSLDNYATNIATPSATGGTIALSAAQFQTVSTPITFRIYGWNATSATETFSINDFIFSGNVLCITPNAFSVTGGGSYCQSNPTGVAIGLSGSQIGISYQLKRNGSNIDAPIAGTGNVISFVLQTLAGTYTVVGTNTTSGCGGTLQMTGDATVAVNAAPVAGSISGGGTTVCSGSNSTVLTLSGQSGQIQWHSSTDNVNFAPISGATTSSYTATNLNATTYYRAVLSNGLCNPATTASVVINVSQASVAGSVSGATTVCAGGNSTVLTLSGHTGSVQWQSSTNGVSFSDISGQTANTYTATNLTATTYYRAALTSVCATVYTTPVTMTVNSAPVAGSITGGDVSVCSAANNTVLTLSGSAGTIQWQSSSDNISFSDVPGQSGTTLTAANLTATTYFRAVVSNSPCAAATTSSVAINVSPASVAGSITGGAIVCAGSNSTILTLSGNTGTIQWQSSPDNLSFSDISGANQQTFTASNLAATTYYRAVVSSGVCASAETLSVAIVVNQQPVAGSIGGGNVTVCSSGNSTTLTLSGHSGSVQWQSSSDNISFTDISGQTANTFTITNLGVTTYYRAVVANAPCASATTDSVSITVANTAEVGTILGGGVSCGQTTVLTLSAYAGTIQWQSSVDDVQFIDIAGETSFTYNVPVSGSMYYRVVVTNGGCTAISASVNVSGSATTIWNGTTWSNGTPDASTAAIFEGNFTAGANLEACSITVNSGAILIPAGFDVNLSGAMTVNGGTFTLENTANLLQTSSVANTGNIIVKRNSSEIRRQDYTLWSSPVANQNLLAFSPLTVTSPTSRFYQYNSATNLYSSIASPGSVNFNDAQGYLIRVANNHPSWPTVWNGQFNGVPHNGDYSYNMLNGGAGLRFNLVGNPYPSPISMMAFASANASQITQTLYFWRETNNNTSNNAYCTWSPAGGGNGTFVSNGEAAVVDPQGVLQTGQGFFVEATASGTQVNFSNAMRIGNNANQFFRPAAMEMTEQSHRIWLNVTNAEGAFSQTAFGYMPEATNEFDPGIEGKLINDGDTQFYSIVDSEKLAIQGRALPFEVNDVVPMGFKAGTAGTYSIAIDHVDGLFTEGQPVYLKDNLTGTQHLLNDGPYAFTTDAGEFTSRFEVLYQSALATVNPTLENAVAIVRNNGVFAINAGNAIIDNVNVFDIRGRLLLSLKDIDASQTQFAVNGANQVLIVKIESTDGQLATRKVIN